MNLEVKQMLCEFEESNSASVHFASFSDVDLLGKPIGIRANVEHPLRVIKCQFGFVKVRCRGLGGSNALTAVFF